MRTEAARPLRALAVMLCLYGGGRLALAARYPEFAVLGFQPIAHASELPSGPIAQVSAIGSVLRASLAPIAVPLPGLAALPVIPVFSARRAVLVIPIPPRAPHVAADFAGPARSLTPGVPLARETRLARVATPARTNPDNQPALTVGSDAVQAALPPMLDHRRAFSGSGWLLLREGSTGASLAPGGTLGGSQVGARVNWQPSAAPVFLTVRASAALSVRDSEIAPGIGVRGRAGGVILEQRVPLQRGRSSRTALLAYGGVSDVQAPAGVTLDGYAQAGVVGVGNPALFIDGAARGERKLATIGTTRLGIGAGVWAAAQPGTARLDVGPQAVLHLPLGPAGARLSAEYRARVAGQARPGNGFTLTLGAGF